MEIGTIILALISAATGGGLGMFFTLKSVKKKASAEAQKVLAEAKRLEIENENYALELYKKIAEELDLANKDRSALHDELEESRRERSEVLGQVEKLRKQVGKLTTVNNKMVKLLDKITPENLEQMVVQIKKLHDECI